jgi:hypothetical protein
LNGGRRTIGLGLGGTTTWVTGAAETAETAVAAVAVGVASLAEAMGAIETAKTAANGSTTPTLKAFMLNFLRLLVRRLTDAFPYR